jgi:hypothetical protein
MYQKPRLERFGTLRELTQGGWDGGGWSWWSWWLGGGQQDWNTQCGRS